MFQPNPSPVVNPNTGGILQNLEVAAQPIQVAQAVVPKSKAVRLKPLPKHGFVNWVSGFTELDLSNSSLEEVIELWNAPSSVEFRAKNRPPSEVIPEGYGVAEDGRFVPLVVDKLPTEEGGVTAINNASDAATKLAITEGRVTPTDAEKAAREAKTLAASLLKGQETETDFQALLKKLGPKNITDFTKWNAQAKKLLGIDEDESDVPEWAAPMFLFGLNLMQGPVSSKTEGQGLLGGLLSDVGAAGEKGFALFAAERARKRKEKAQIATLSMQLESADTKQKQLYIDAFQASKSAELKLSQAGSKLTNDLAGRVLQIAGTGEDDDTYKRRALGVNALFNNMNSLTQVGLTAQDMMNPPIMALLMASSTNAMGLPTPDMEIETVDYGPYKFSYDAKAIEPAFKRFNKENPDNPLSTPFELLSMIVTKDPRVADKKWQGLVFGNRILDSTFSTEERENADGEKITDHVIYTAGAFNEWKAEFIRKENREPSETEIRDNEFKWRTIVRSNLKKSPDFQENSFKKANGETVKFYWNPKAFANRRKSDNTLTLQKVINDQKAYPGIIAASTTDYSQLQPNLATMTVGVDGNNKRVFSYDKTAVGQAIREGKIDPSKDYIQQIIEAKLGGYSGAPIPIKKDESVFTIGPDGDIVSYTGQDAKGVVGGLFSKKAMQEWQKRGTGLVQLHRLGYD